MISTTDNEATRTTFETVRTRPALHEDEDETEAEAKNSGIKATLASRT